MEKSRKFKSNIAQLRKKARLTQRSLAIAMDVTEATIRNWEKGALDWIEKVAALCDIFECLPSDLLKNFKQMREQDEWTQAELAQALKVTENTIAQWEKGNFDSAKKAVRLCELLDCDLDDLYDNPPEINLYKQNVLAQRVEKKGQAEPRGEKVIDKAIKDLMHNINDFINLMSEKKEQSEPEVEKVDEEITHALIHHLSKAQTFLKRSSGS